MEWGEVVTLRQNSEHLACIADTTTWPYTYLLASLGFTFLTLKVRMPISTYSLCVSLFVGIKLNNSF